METKEKKPAQIDMRLVKFMNAHSDVKGEVVDGKLFGTSNVLNTVTGITSEVTEEIEPTMQAVRIYLGY